MHFSHFLNRLDSLDAPPLLGAVVLQATVLLTVGLVAAYGLESRPAATRFRVLWLSALSAPVLLAFALFSTSLKEGPALTVLFSDSPVTIGALSEKAKIPDSTVPSPVAAVPIQTSGPAGEWALDWTPLLGMIWLSGIGVVVARVGFQRWRLWRGTKAWREERAGHAWRMLGEIAAESGLKRTPRLFVSAGWVMPATWGWRRPAVVLPLESQGWSAGILRHVLIHECGHVVRRDAPVFLLARLALGLLWFHPLAWVARRQLAVLRETACDDWVLTFGRADPQAYGSDLLALVKDHFSRKDRTSAAGISMAMAQSSSVGKRIRRLLQEDVNRNPAGRWVSSGILAGWVVLVAILPQLVSCRTTSISTTSTPPGGASGAGLKYHQKLEFSPKKAPPGVAKISFGIIDIIVPGSGHHFLRPWTTSSMVESQAGKLGSIMIPAHTTVLRTNPQLSFSSLRALSQVKGVDLMSVGTPAEGQELRFGAIADYRFPTVFDGEGNSMEFETKEVGVRMTVTGERILNGTMISADVKLSIIQIVGFDRYRFENGREVTQPRFSAFKTELKSLQIPNGGFTVLENAAHESREQSVTDEKLLFFKVTHKEKIFPYLAIFAQSDPVPPAAVANGPLVPLDPPVRQH